MTLPSDDRHADVRSGAHDDPLDVLLRFGASMLRCGNTAIRTRECIGAMARKLGLTDVSVSAAFDHIVISIPRSDAHETAMREIGPPAINASRIVELQRLAKAGPEGSTPRDIATKLAEIESAPPRYSGMQIVAAIAVASGGFAFLNGAATLEMVLAGIAGGAGQWSRVWFSRRNLNQFGVVALAALVASGAYVLAVELADYGGLNVARHPAGFTSSVLFLVPGFPLLAALFDLLNHQTTAAVGRLAYGTMVLLAVAFGLSFVIALAGVDIARQPPLDLPYPFTLSLRAIASFGAGCAFAMLFNTPARTVLAVGFLALAANELRLVLHDLGMMLAPAAFLSALFIGIVALVVEQRFHVPPIVLTVPAIIIMVPGVYAFETIVFLNRAQVLDALQAFALCGFIVGALAAGLATARFLRRG